MIGINVKKISRLFAQSRRYTVRELSKRSTMTIDERLDRLTERHEAMAQTLELWIHENRERQAEWEKRSAEWDKRFAQNEVRFEQVADRFDQNEVRFEQVA